VSEGSWDWDWFNSPIHLAEKTEKGSAWALFSDQVILVITVFLLIRVEGVDYIWRLVVQAGGPVSRNVPVQCTLVLAVDGATPTRWCRESENGLRYANVTD
jgi:hypothetical protein